MNTNETPNAKSQELDAESLDQVVGGAIMHEVGAVAVPDITTTDAVRKAGQEQQTY